MYDESFASIITEALFVALLFSAIPLGTSLLVGLIVSVFQAATQINEQTLSFVPKLASVVLVLFLLGPWMLEHLREFTIHALEHSALFKIK